MLSDDELNKEEMALEALIKVICEIKNNGENFVNVINPDTMQQAIDAIKVNGWLISEGVSWVPSFSFFYAVKDAQTPNTTSN